MRSLRSLVLSALLLASTATSTLAYDGHSSLQLTIQGTEHTYDDGGGYARPVQPYGERSYDDGGGYTSPTTTPSQPSEYERWV